MCRPARQIEQILYRVDQDRPEVLQAALDPARASHI
jgi:hypothetical protein